MSIDIPRGRAPAANNTAASKAKGIGSNKGKMFRIEHGKIEFQSQDYK